MIIVNRNLAVRRIAKTVVSKLGIHSQTKFLEHIGVTVAHRIRWGRRPYVESYRRTVNRRAAQSFWWGVGSTSKKAWEDHGLWLQRYLVSSGMRAEHVMLDIGCGNLRIGVHAIDYLDSGNYWGIDISSANIAKGREFVVERGLDSKAPRLFVNENLRFEELAGTLVDVILANSVFTHLPIDLIEECIASLDTVLQPDGVFFATFDDGTPKFHSVATGTFFYPRGVLIDLCGKYGYSVEFDDEFRHPHKQTMMLIKKMRA